MTTPTRRLKSVPALGALILSACSGGGYGAAGPSAPYGGNVAVQSTATGASASAAFVTAVAGSASLPSLTGDPFSQIPQGGCISITPNTAQSPSMTLVSAGPAVTLKSGSTTITLSPGNTEPYVATPASVPAGIYDVTLAGNQAAGIPAQTWNGALAQPAAIGFTAPAGFAGGSVLLPTSTGSLTFTWMPFGATDVVFSFQDGAGGGQTCRANDSGSFTVPGETFTNLPFSGTLVVTAVTHSVHDLNGRGVVLSGASSASVSFTKTGGCARPGASCVP